MKTKLLQSTPNMIDVIYTAARTCYNSGSPVDMWDDVNNVSEEKKLKLIKNCISSGHHSTLEHAYFTFAIEGVDRAITHQSVRHRLCSNSQQSQRYVQLKDGCFSYTYPPTISDEDRATYDECMSHISSAYKVFVDNGMKAEDARSVLPNATKTNLVMSCNLRELIHICHLRLCTRAQAPIRKMVASLVANVVEVEPWLKPYLVAKCEANGFCNEEKGCGRKPYIKDVLEGYRRYIECDY